MEVEFWPLDKITPYEGNPRTIGEDAVTKVAASIQAFGFQQPIVVDKKGIIIVGHTRHMAAQQLGLKNVPVVVARLSPAKARAYRIADNRTNEEAEWNEDQLRAEIDALAHYEGNGLFTGFDPAELTRLLNGQPLYSDDELVEPEAEPDLDKSKLLDLINIVIDPPKFVVEKGDHFLIHDRHHLLCVGVMTGWPVWAPLLTAGCVFCPYPGPFVTHGKIPDEHTLVLVQPDPYTCGHILDRLVEMYKKKAIVRVTE
jgi:ParB/Sulfiredoxin domain